jgi:hypothetical protein
MRGEGRRKTKGDNGKILDESDFGDINCVDYGVYKVSWG